MKNKSQNKPWSKANQQSKSATLMDVHNKHTRSYNMSRIKGKNTKPEIALDIIICQLYESQIQRI